MARRSSRREVLRWGALSATAGVAGCLGPLTGKSSEAQLREHEDALSELADLETALDRGYETTGTYVRTDEGVLGVPFVNPEITELKPEEPKAVLFGLTEDATYEPLGLKWYVPAEGRDSAPTLFGKKLSGPRESEAILIPEHYALHAWLFRENPDGLFATYNSAVETPAIVDRIAPVREHLSQYFIGSEARKNGYTNTETCIATPDGGYGVPYVRDGTDGSGGTDPEKPPILLYRLTENWTYRLMGAEWYVPADGADSPPNLFGRTFHDPMAGHSDKTQQPEHYGLHAWFFRANPRGMFEPLHPDLTC